MRIPKLAGMAVLSWSAAAILPAQQPGPVRETAEVSLVEVPVRVTDREGKPVAGLSAKDFTVTDDGKKQSIVGFDVIDLAEKTAAAPASAPLPAAARRRFLILFDLSFARPKAIVAARRAAKEFVLTDMGDRDLAAVATYSVEKGLNLLVTFCNDRAQLAHAIDTLGIQATAVQGDPLAFVFDARQLSAAFEGRAGTGRSEASSAAILETLQVLASLQRARVDEYSRGRVRHLIGSFSALAEALDAVEGRKDVIYLSEGFQSRLLVGAQETSQEKEWILSGEMWKVDSEKRFGNTPLRTELSDMTALFRRSDCVIHAVDIAGIRAEPDGQAEAASLGPRESQDSLFEIADGTGGEVFRNANDLASQLNRLIARTNLVYVLAFRPDHSRKEGEFHELKVKVAASGAHVSARAGYYERRGFRQQSPLERRLSAADVIANEIPVDEIPARVIASTLAGTDGSAFVPVLIEVPGGRFLAGEKGEKATAEVYVYANDQDNRVRDFFVQAVSLDLAKNRERLESGGFRYHGELRLPPGEYRIRALVRNAETGRMGLSVSSLHVPSFVSDQPYLLQPVFLEEKGNWLSVLGRARPDGGAAGSAGYPGSDLNTELSPAALPRIEPGRESKVCVVAYHFGSPGAENLRLGSQILASDGRPLQEARLAVLGKSTPETDGRRTLLLSFTMPEGLAPGRYGLRIMLQDAATGLARQASAPFLVP